MIDATTATPLQQALAEIHEFRWPSDHEEAHVNADAALIHALQHLAESHPERETILALIAEWNALAKWYA